MKNNPSGMTSGYTAIAAPTGGISLLATVPTALFLLCQSGIARADEYFDPAALEFANPQQKTADLRYFAKSGGQQPGTYSVSIWVNNQEITRGEVTFIDSNGALQPQLTPAQLAEYGVNVSAFSAFQSLHEGQAFTHIERYIPDASSRFDFADQRLILSIPQAAMNVQSRGYVDPARWDDGIPAAFVNYNLTGSQTRQPDDNSQSSYLNLRSGVNLGAWRLRNVSSMEYDRTRRWNSQSTWLQRDVKSLKSLLRMGDTFTTGDVFDSVQFRGIQLMSDDEMLPDSQRGFAPTIRGMAHSNAKVTISQHGYVIYETFVSPGAFAINDLYPTAQSGDLEVQVKESDGSVRTFTQPFSAVPFMLREGRVKYNLSAGRFRSAQRQGSRRRFYRARCFMGYRLNSRSTAVASWRRITRRGRLASGAVWANWGRSEAMRRGQTPQRRRESARQVIRCACSIRRILPARGLHSVSPAIATPPAATMTSAKRIRLKAATGCSTTSAAAKKYRFLRPLAVSAAWRYPPGRRSTGTVIAAMKRCISDFTAPGEA